MPTVLEKKTKTDKHHTTTHSKYFAFYSTVNVEVVDNLPRYNRVFVEEAEMNFKQRHQDHVQSFLADLHSQGYQTNSLNAYRSAISSVHDRVDGVDVGKHPLIARVFKGVFHTRSPLSRYTATWNVQVVLDSILN